jgi:hypothetical protein
LVVIGVSLPGPSFLHKIQHTTTAHSTDKTLASQPFLATLAISTAFVESTINWVVSKRMVKKQQMRWTKPGAHLLLQVRTKTLNGELRDAFCQWYPHMTAIGEHLPRAA